MKYLLAFLMLIPTVSLADVYIVTAPDKSVYSLSEQNDAVIPANFTVDVLPGSIDDLGLTRPVDEYKFVNKKFKVDAQVVKQKEDKALEHEQKQNAKKATKQSAKDKLKALGLTGEEVNEVVQ